MPEHKVQIGVLKTPRHGIFVFLLPVRITSSRELVICVFASACKRLKIVPSPTSASSP